MKVLRARVSKGKFVLEDPKTTLPEGTVVWLLLDEHPDAELDVRGAEHAALRAALRRSRADFEAGRHHSWDEVAAERKVIARPKR